MYKNEMSKEEWAKAAQACDNQEWATSTPEPQKFSIEDMAGMHRKFNDINTSLEILSNELHGILFVCASREDAEKLKPSTPLAMPEEICNASIADNLRHIEEMIIDAMAIISGIDTALGIEP